MRLHRSQALQTYWYILPSEVRAFVESLKQNPRPDKAVEFPEEPNYYEEFIAGYWIGWEIDESTSETLIRVTILD